MREQVFDKNLRSLLFKMIYSAVVLFLVILIVSCQKPNNKKRESSNSFPLNQADQEKLLNQYSQSLAAPSEELLQKMLLQGMVVNQIFRNPKSKVNQETPASVIIKYDPNEETNIKKLELLYQNDMRVDYRNGKGESLKYLAILMGKEKVFYYLHNLYPFFENEFSEKEPVDLIKASTLSNQEKILKFILMETDLFTTIPKEVYTSFIVALSPKKPNQKFIELIQLKYKMSAGLIPIDNVQALFEKKKFHLIQFISESLDKENYSIPNYFSGTNVLYHLSAIKSEEALALMKSLLNSGLNPNGENNLDIPIHHAVKNLNGLAIDLLIEFNGNEDILDRRNFTPFFNAIKIPSYEMALTLISRGADTEFTYENRKGKKKTREACSFISKLLRKRNYKKDATKKKDLEKIEDTLDC